jgi:Tfp pilus assembly protein PilV
LELLIGVLILSVGLLAIGGLQIASVRGNAFSQHMTQATYIAHDRLEFLKNLPFSDSQLQENHYQEQKVTVAGVDFLREYTVTQEGTLKRIEYIVSWNDGRNHRITFSTIRSQ